MASQINIESGSLFIGNPIIVSALSKADNNLSTFHQVKLEVKAKLSTDKEYETFVLSNPAGSLEKVTFDISDTLRAVTTRYRYKPVSADTTYPFVQYQLTAWDDYMMDGTLHEKVDVVQSTKTYVGLMGSFSDDERLEAGTTRRITSFTCKPKKGEVCSQQETIVFPKAASVDWGMDTVITTGPSVTTLNLQSSTGPVSAGGRTVYVDPSKKDLVQFQFVNRMGIVESITAKKAYQMVSKGGTEKGSVSPRNSFELSSWTYAVKNNRQISLKCNTGLLTPEWLAWWYNDFFASDDFRKGLTESCWINIKGKWIPCAAYLDDDMVVYDTSEAKMLDIRFTVDLPLQSVIPFL